MAKVRLQDVAEVAGVSMKTVSNVVRNRPIVRPETRERVERVIKDLGYRPNLRGRSLATGRTGMIALAFPDLRVPYFAELAHVVSDVAAERGYRLLIEETGGTVEGERAIASAAEAGIVDGVLFQPARLSGTEIAMHRLDVPMVLLGEGPAPLSVDRVMADNVAGATLVTQHLAALGRRRIGFLGHEERERSSTSDIRLLGYQAGLEASGLALDMSLLISSESVSPLHAANALRAALDAGLQIDGLVCRDDQAAVGALRALADHGISVPDQVAVTGWDDIDMAAFTLPSLTSLRVDTRQLAARALDLLAERIGGFDGLGRHELVDFSLVVRESAPTS
ncbi:LacI family DNA-binding transcriptional regulator [Curtobacterium sp. ISL-83]|uniref:LacI family DNA-binding transcriptional regulator n=1 Tax=Curtobacterium sp. ISL-83 TaxID=2819145 RepID=UPI001BE65DDD|nr:LacI family DNA-binding transcriptional regulator [Curtobacterium sp. ISL-83]MBT2503543.1 LacI family DNA-binding transcriptional regulator [Curtobacterium sp. ISL-83]